MAIKEKILDWFDQRLGVRELYEKHISYPLPERMTIWHFAGGILIGTVLIQIVTGIYMASYFVPEPELAHQSIRDMCNGTVIGALFRNLHRWSATIGILVLFIHMFHVMARRAYLAPRELNWWSGLIMGGIFFALLVTGIMLPWDWRSYWELVIWTDWVDTIPLIGGILKGPMLQMFSLGRNYVAHVFILPGALILLIMLHLVLFRRLGMSEKV